METRHQTSKRSSHRRPLAFAMALVTILTACSTTESHRVVETSTVESYGTKYVGPKCALSIGHFSNNSPYLRGIFSDDEDRLGGQAKTILKTHLSQTNRFDLLDRENMSAIRQESDLSGQELELEGAEFVITGQVTEFGRKTTGDKQLFGILGRGKRQIAYSKVSVSVVDVKTSRVVHSVQGAGEYSLSEREIVGFGSSAGYDSTLNGKVLNLAITDSVNKLVRALEAGDWGPEKQ
ncbi:MAG: curli biogenesis system outer membrane secretion channel CsgG [Planctomycetota bacterium]|jgi:curli biogenesis system outer membrane secretion channel CsgG